MDATKTDIDYATRVIKACVEHARTLLAPQLQAVEARNYDFDPGFQKTITELFLVGIMWRFGEQFDLPTNARDRAFMPLMQMLVADGMSLRAAKRRIRELNESSRDKDGKDCLAIHVGYEAGNTEGALVAVFDEYCKLPAVSSAPRRLLERSRPIAAILASAAVAISLLTGSNWGVALGFGVVVGVSALGIALALFRQMVKPSKRSP